MSPAGDKRLLLVRTSQPAFLERLASSAGEAFELIGAPSLARAREFLAARRPAALLTDMEQAGSRGDELLRLAHETHPDLPVALIAPTTDSRCYPLMRTYGLRAALSPDPTSLRACAAVFLKHLTCREPASGLRPYLPAGHPVARRRIGSSASRTEAQAALSDAFASSRHVDAHDLHLVFEETLNNAILHAFRTEHNTRKYSGDMDRDLDKGDRITVEWVTTNAFSALAVTDNQGLLSPGDMWDRFFRQTSLTGLLDTNGRGLYLTHLLSRVMLATVSPGERTEVAAFFATETKSSEKAVSFRVAPADA